MQTSNPFAGSMDFLKARIGDGDVVIRPRQRGIIALRVTLLDVEQLGKR